MTWSTTGDDARSRKAAATRIAIVVVAVILLAFMPEIAHAQGNPFAVAEQEACKVQQSLTTFASAIGGIGMVICLMLGYFNKLNWKWLSTGIGVCFAINLVPELISFLGGGASC